MTESLLTCEQLTEWTGYKRPGDIEKFLIAKRVPYWHCKNHKPITTLEALNSVLIPNGRERKKLEFT